MNPVNTAEPHGLQWFPTKLLADLIVWAAALWAGLLVVVMLVAWGIDWWGAAQVDSSYWLGAGSQIPRWFGLFIGVHLGYTLMPLHIAHGYTRREFAVKGLTFTLVYAAALAALVCVGFLVEAGVYSLGGWPQTVHGRHLFESLSQGHLVFLELWMAQALWIAGGAFIAAAAYRNDSLGGVAIAIAVVVATVAEMAIGGFGGPFAWILERLGWTTHMNFGAAIPLYLVCIAALLAMSWPIVRDIPLRSKSA